MEVQSTDLSIIITTSPIPCHPDTQVIDDSINSIQMQPTLKNIHIYIVCDGVKITSENQYKSGIITEETNEKYLLYKETLHKKYNNKNKYTIIEKQSKCGFAENIKFVMENYAQTEHVLIYQHDHVLEKVIDFNKVIETLKTNSKEINYITFMHKSYRTIIERQIAYPKVKAFLLKLLQKEENFNYNLNKKHFQETLINFFENKFGLPLVPLNFWYDKVHIAKRSYYLNVIFNKEGNFDFHRDKNMKTVSFVEDTFGHCMKSTIAEHPEKLLEYGAFVLWNEEPVFYHQSGRAFITEEEKENYRKEGKKEPESSDPEEENFEGIDFDEMVKIE